MNDPAIDRTIELRGLSFHYREYERDGRPLVLLHGVASSSRIFILLGPILGQRFRALALDQRGHGESAKPDDGYDFDSVTKDLKSFIDALELERPVIVGHSWGGNVAMQYAADYPDRVAGLVLVDGGFLEISARPGATWEQAERQMAPPDMTHLRAEELIEMAKKWELGTQWSEEIEAAILGNFEIMPNGKIRARLSRANHMQVVRALWDQKVSELAPNVVCPVLFIAAERAGSEGSERWMEMKRAGIERAEGLLRQVEVVWMKDTIHDIPLHKPRELAQLIEDFVLKL